MTKRPFTLLELMVVIAIIAITSTLAVSTLRGESPARKLESASLAFKEYCSRARYAAMENGSAMAVFFDLDRRRFQAMDPSAAPDDSGSGGGGTDDASPELVWELPDGFTLDSALKDADSGGTGRLEIFRFFPDGTANASREFILRYQTLQRKFTISPLTGLLLETEEAAEP